MSPVRRRPVPNFAERSGALHTPIPRSRLRRLHPMLVLAAAAHRTWTHPAAKEILGSMTNDSTQGRPIAAAIAVVVRGERLLLVRRRHRPDAGRWGFPGGKIEAGETIVAAALRELGEETGVAAEAIEVLTAVDVIRRDGDGTLHHYVLIAVLCRWTRGEGAADDDAEDAAWFDLAALGDVPKSPDVERVAKLALARNRC